MSAVERVPPWCICIDPRFAQDEKLLAFAPARDAPL